MSLLRQIDDKLGENWRGVAGLIAGALMLTLAAVAVGLIGSAKADTLNGKGKIAAPAPVAETVLTSTAARWSGPWVAGTLGYAVQATDVSGIFAEDLSFATHNLTYGVSGGYDHLFAGTNLLVGIGADISWSRAESVVASWDRQWSVWGRGGVLLTPSTLAYGLAGFTELGGSFEIPQLGERRGLMVGAGVETLFKDGWFLGLEGRWVDLGGDSGGGVSTDSNQYEAKARLGYRFGAAK